MYDFESRARGAAGGSDRVTPGRRRSGEAMRISVLALAAAAATCGFAGPATGAGGSVESSAGGIECISLALHPCPQPYDARLPRAEDMLSWDPHSRVIGFRNAYRLYKGDVFRTLQSMPYPLPSAPDMLPTVRYRLDGRTFGVEDYLRRQNVTGLLIVKDGRIAYEHYARGNTPTTLWTSRSVAKSVVSILVGMAIKEGSIGSVSDPISRYLPELRGGAWEGVTLRELLQHVSGVAWNENYADPTSDFAQMTRCEAGTEPYDCVMHLVRSVKRKDGVEPGSVWSYNTGGAWLVGQLLERATGMTLAKYLESRLWSRFGMQSDGVWQALVPDKADMGGHGFNATLRDWGRFGLFVADGGTLASGEELLPANWLAQSTTWTKAKDSVTPQSPDGQYGYQWWFIGADPARPGASEVNETARQAFWAVGIYGQAIAINRAEHLVVVQWSTWKQASGPAAMYDEQAFFVDAVTRALHRTE